MLMLLTALAFAQQPPAAAPGPEPSPTRTERPKFGVGFVYDLGFVPSDVSIGWAGQAYVEVGAAVGFSCFGGRGIAIAGTDDVLFGVEGTYCRALSYRVDAASRSVGFFGGYRQELEDGRYAGFQIGVGYSGGVVIDPDITWEGMYVRPRGSVMMERGPLGFDVGPFIQIPIFFTQKVEGGSEGAGMLTRIGVELTVYAGRFGN